MFSPPPRRRPRNVLLLTPSARAPRLQQARRASLRRSCGRGGRTHRVRFIFSRFSSLLGPLPAFLSMGPQSCWTARNMALCILVPCLGRRWLRLGALAALFIRDRGWGGASQRQTYPSGRRLAGCGPAVTVVTEGSGSEDAADVRGPASCALGRDAAAGRGPRETCRRPFALSARRRPWPRRGLRRRVQARGGGARPPRPPTLACSWPPEASWNTFGDER